MGQRQYSLDLLFVVQTSQPAPSLLPVSITRNPSEFALANDHALIYLAENDHARKSGLGVVWKSRMEDEDSWRESISSLS